jgi:hypothetical protein
VSPRIAIPPQPRLFVLRRFNDTTLPVFHTPQGDAIPLSVTECGQLVLVDLDIDSGTVIVEDSARSVEFRGRTQTFVIRSGLPAATRSAELVTDAYFPRLVPDSDAVAFRIDHSDGTQTSSSMAHTSIYPTAGAAHASWRSTQTAPRK